MPHAVFDACCFINLYATGDLRGFLTGAGWTWHVPTAALAESLFIRRPGDDDQDGRELIDTQPCIDEGMLSVVAVTGEREASEYVRLAAHLDDGEAMAIAIAFIRGWTLATDDRKARRIAAELAVPVVTTPEMIRQWARRVRMSRRRLRTTLTGIQTGARFIPVPDAPGYDWWMDSVNG